MPCEETAAPDFGFDDATHLEVVTDFLYPDQEYKPAIDAMPVGLLLLSPTQTAKNAFLCDGYLRELRTFEEASAAEPDSDFLITYWLLGNRPADFESCDSLLNSYDWQRASELRSLYGLNEFQGPVIVAVDAANDTVFLDLTDATPEAARVALKSWLSLALEESNSANGDEADIAEIGAGVAATGVASAHAFTLASFSSRIKSRMLTDGGSGLAVTEHLVGDGRRLYAYKDPDTGYRVGSSIRF